MILTRLDSQMEAFACYGAQIVASLAVIFATVVVVHLEKHQLPRKLIQVRRLAGEQLIVLEPFDLSLGLRLHGTLDGVRFVHLHGNARGLVLQSGRKVCLLLVIVCCGWI